MATIIISKELVTRMTNLTLNKAKAAKLADNLLDRMEVRYELLQNYIEGWCGEPTLDDFVEKIQKETCEEFLFLEHLLGYDQEAEPDWDHLDLVGDPNNPVYIHI